jgi:hypothetical protein
MEGIKAYVDGNGIQSYSSFLDWLITCYGYEYSSFFRIWLYNDAKKITW